MVVYRKKGQTAIRFFQKQSIKIVLSSVLMRVGADAKFNNWTEKFAHYDTPTNVIHAFFIRTIL